LFIMRRKNMGVSSLVAAMAAATAVAGIATAPSYAGPADTPAAAAGYQVQLKSPVGGDGGFDYVYADSDGRRLYVPRLGPTGRVSVFDLDTLARVGEIVNTSGHGAVVDAKYGHGFATSKPVAMWDAKTLTPIKTIDVDGRPDGILGDPFNHRVYILSHSAPNVTVIDAKDGSVLGTIDLGGAPEQAATDGKGTIYIDIEDQGAVAVVDAKTMKVTGKYDLNGKGAGNAGLALDAKNHILFVACRNPQTMVILDATSGKYLTDLPIGRGCDGAVFNPDTMECFSSQGDGTLTVIKESSPTTFAVEQTVTTPPGAKTITLDRKTGKLFLITAEYGPAPTPAPEDNGRFRRGPMVPGSFSIVVVGK
jgi:DNA-binding beta-propeller fold protein YncE